MTGPVPEPAEGKHFAEEGRDATRQAWLREMGLPDVGTPEFAAEARRQSLLAAAADRENDDQDFIDSISEFDWE